MVWGVLKCIGGVTGGGKCEGCRNMTNFLTHSLFNYTFVVLIHATIANLFEVCI